MPDLSRCARRTARPALRHRAKDGLTYEFVHARADELDAIGEMMVAAYEEYMPPDPPAEQRARRMLRPPEVTP